MQKGGAQQLSGIFIHKGGGYTTSVEYLSRVGGYTTSVENLSRGGGYTTSVEYFSRPPIFPNAPFFHPFFWGGGAVPLCRLVSHSSQLSIFIMVFFLVGGCVAGGGVADFSLSLSEIREGREGSGTTLLSDFC